jgi:hypothetical protein
MHDPDASSDSQRESIAIFPALSQSMATYPIIAFDL